MSLCVAMGNIVPPMDEPIALKPVAKPRLRLNQCPMTPNVGPKIIPQAS
jgi:hypothetical protein